MVEGMKLSNARKRPAQRRLFSPFGSLQGVEQNKATGLTQKAIDVILSIPALAAVILCRMIKSFVLVRFGALPSNKIGHFAANTELYLCFRDRGAYGSRTFDIFYCFRSVLGGISNYQLKKMIGRILCIFPRASLFYRINQLIPGGEAHNIHLPSDRDVQGFLRSGRPHIRFTDKEIARGEEELVKLGIPRNAAFVCFHSRDAVYLEKKDPSANWRYHDYRDSDIDNYAQAARVLSRRGYYLIRMGAAPKKPLKTDDERIIDYASKCRSDFLDIYLLSKCRFFICSSTGIGSVASIFRRPVAWVNFIPLEYAHTWGDRDLFIPKKIWLRKERRFLTFREILDFGVGRFLRTEEYERLGIDAVENTPEEIAALAIEMDERLSGTRHDNEEDKELQEYFWSLFKPSELHGDIVSRIGADFLRRNPELLKQGKHDAPENAVLIQDKIK